jgi:WD40 repeat protein
LLFRFKEKHGVEPTNYAEDHILNNPKTLQKQANQKNVCAFCFQGEQIFTGYEDGLICAWDSETNNLNAPLVGHSNRINALAAADSNFLFSASNDCTVR